jgi:hypothetical protein
MAMIDKAIGYYMKDPQAQAILSWKDPLCDGEQKIIDDTEQQDNRLFPVDWNTALLMCFSRVTVA